MKIPHEQNLSRSNYRLTHIYLLFTSLLFAPLLTGWQTLSLTDSDNDGVADLTDIDDDNDGIPDAVEQYCANPTLANSISGTGAYQDNIYWFNWTDADFSDGLDDGDSQTFVLSDGTTITASISNVVNLGNQGGDRYYADDINTWSGAKMHYLYNTLGGAEVFHSGGSTGDDVSFDITFSATKKGITQELDYIVVDGESTNGKGEYINLTTNQGIWVALENYGSGATYTGDGTQTINITNTENSGAGNTVFYSENATVFNLSINNHGGQAVGFGIYLECDTDNDGLFNHLDLDSDNDGIPDLVEAGGADADGDGLPDSQIDSDGDGLLDVFETAHGSTSILFDANGDGVNEKDWDMDGDGAGNWADLDSDGDGIVDVVEAGGADIDQDGLIDNHTTDTDSDGYADGVDGDVGNDGSAENFANALLLTSADANTDGLPDSGYPNGNTDLSGNPDFLDIDADGDGIVDNTEGQRTSEHLTASGSDDDNDGLDNAYDDDDSSFGGNGILAVDTDGDNQADYQDTDSDEDTILDIIEGHDTDGDFVADMGSPSGSGESLGVDADEDGLDDGFDNNTSVWNPSNSGLSPTSHPKYNGGLDQDWRAQQTLSMNFLYFEVKLKDRHVYLNWELERDLAGSTFQILRKTARQTAFESIGQLKSNSHPIYEFKDQRLPPEIAKQKVLYQLKRIYPDGKEERSPIVELLIPRHEIKLEIYPNPGTTHITIASRGANLSHHIFTLFDTKGNVVFEKAFKKIRQKSFKLNTSKLRPGIYLLQTRFNLQKENRKIVIQ